MRRNERPSEYGTVAGTAWLFNLPMVLLTVVFIAVPVCGTLLTSLYRNVTFLPEQWVGLQTYQRLLGDPFFWQSVRFTALFLLASVVLELGLGLSFALLLNERLAGRGFLRVAVLVPWAIPMAVSARVWEHIYNYEFGLFNFLMRHLGIAETSINWLGSAPGAFAALVISDVWKTTPFVTIIALAGFSAIPQDLYRQAMIDGTHFGQRFRYITLPLLRPVLVVALLFRTIDAIRIFDLIYVLTGGGPGGATTSVSLYAFQYYVSGDFGYGSAVSLVVFLLAGLLAAGYIRAGRFGEVLR
ncbi:MAG: sugar ABC transporter permease [Desulfobacteraceae bacterium]|nr:MAG: sugar ABC transporter permease [Desulfobacteraceae bacterium]